MFECRDWPTDRARPASAAMVCAPRPTVVLGRRGCSSAGLARSESSAARSSKRRCKTSERRRPPEANSPTKDPRRVDQGRRQQESIARSMARISPEAAILLSFAAGDCWRGLPVGVRPSETAEKDWVAWHQRVNRGRTAAGAWASGSSPKRCVPAINSGIDGASRFTG